LELAKYLAAVGMISSQSKTTVNQEHNCTGRLREQQVFAMSAMRFISKTTQ